VSYSKLRTIWGLGSGRKRNGQREGKVTKRQSLVRMQPFAWKKKQFLYTRISHMPVTLTLSTPWMHADLEIVVCKFGRNPAICPQEEAIFVRSQKCPYHVTFDLDLEHTLDAHSPETIVCKFGHNPAICLQEEAIFVPAQKCPYHVTFDLYLEHTQDVG